MEIKELADKLKEKGLKVTPQRLSVLAALYSYPSDHPTAEDISEIVRKQTPHIATGTIYKILEAFVDKGIISRIKTDRDIMRYDAFTNQHHHLYSVDSERIEDYYDEKLNSILNEYFKNQAIPGFSIENLQLQIKGRFTKG